MAKINIGEVNMKENIEVKLSPHVAEKSFPLRLGYIGKTGSIIELIEPREVKGGHSGCKKFIAGIKNPETLETDRMTCIVGPKGGLRTAYFKDDKVETGFSDMTKHFDSEVLLELHPSYKKGLITRFESFTTALLKTYVKIGEQKSAEEIAEYKQLIGDFMDHIKLQEDVIKKLNDQGTKAEDQVSYAGAKWIESEFRARGMLDDVKIVLRWNNYKNTNEEYLNTCKQSVKSFLEKLHRKDISLVV